MRVEAIDWDDHNLLHATRHGVSAREIEQVLRNATKMHRHPKQDDRRIIQARTDGGRRVRLVVQVRGLGLVRPITAWEA